MIRSTVVALNSQTRTFSPRLTSILAQNVEKLCKAISKKHADTTTPADSALTDLAQLRHVEYDLEQARQTLNIEREAVSAAVEILRGEAVFYHGDHPLVQHAENLVTQKTALQMVDADLTVLDLQPEIDLLTELQSELDDAATVASNRVARAAEVARQARGLALCRAKDVSAAIQNLPADNPLPTHSDEWRNVNPDDPETLINRCRIAAEADAADFATKRKKAVKKVANKQLTALKENN